MPVSPDAEHWSRNDTDSGNGRYARCRDRRLQAEALLHRAAWNERYHRSQQAF